MKKFLTKVACIAIAVSFLFMAGCTGGSAVAKRALNACQTYLEEVNQLKDVFYSENYKYPADAALLAAESVSDSDVSKFGIEYSSYQDFEFVTEAYGHTMISPKTLYYGAVGVLTNFNKYINKLDEETFKLNETYKFVINGSEEYFMVRYNDNTLYINTEKKDYSTLCIIKLNTDGLGWKSVEERQYGYDKNGEINLYHYYYLEKSTNDNRIFDKCEVITWRVRYYSDTKDQINTFDFDETTQKMILIEESFPTGAAEGNAKHFTDFIEALDFSEVENIVNKEKAVLVE